MAAERLTMADGSTVYNYGGKMYSEADYKKKFNNGGTNKEPSQSEGMSVKFLGKTATLRGKSPSATTPNPKPKSTGTGSSNRPSASEMEGELRGYSPQQYKATPLKGKAKRQAKRAEKQLNRQDIKSAVSEAIVENKNDSMGKPSGYRDARANLREQETGKGSESRTEEPTMAMKTRAYKGKQYPIIEGPDVNTTFGQASRQGMKGVYWHKNAKTGEERPIAIQFSEDKKVADVAKKEEAANEVKNALATPGENTTKFQSEEDEFAGMNVLPEAVVKPEESKGVQQAQGVNQIPQSYTEGQRSSFPRMEPKREERTYEHYNRLIDPLADKYMRQQPDINLDDAYNLASDEISRTPRYKMLDFLENMAHRRAPDYQDYLREKGARGMKTKDVEQYDVVNQPLDLNLLDLLDINREISGRGLFSPTTKF